MKITWNFFSAEWVSIFFLFIFSRRTRKYF